MTKTNGKRCRIPPPVWEAHEYSDPTGENDRENRRYFLLAALLSGCVFLYAHFPAFASHYVINDDVRQQIFWMQQWQDPQLYQGDLPSEYARHYVPWGVQGIYRIASSLMSPLYFSKIVAGFLFVMLALCLYSLGKSMGGRRLGLTTVAVFWLMPFFLDNIAGGLARSFAAPLLALFLYCWLTGKARGVGLALLLQALFIPYIFLLCAAAVLLAYAGGLTGYGKAPPFPRGPVHFLVIAVAGSLVALWYRDLNSAGFGPLVSYSAMLGRPEFTEEGRYQILPVASLFWELAGDPLNFIAYLRDGVIKIAAGILTCAALAGITIYGFRFAEWGRFRGRLQPFVYTAAASLLLYALARIFLLQLFIPSRYLTYTVNLFYCLAIAICVLAALQKIALQRKKVIAIFLLAAVLAGIRLRGTGIYDFSADRDLYAALEKTPKDSVIAGHPALMDNVLTFARRRVLASFELSHPWCVGYWARIEPRLHDLFAAYYSDRAESVLEFANKYHVDFIVVDDRDFEPAFLDAHPFFAPFDEMIRKLAKGRKRFALLSDDAFSSAPVGDHFRIVDLRPLKAVACSPTK